MNAHLEAETATVAGSEAVPIDRADVAGDYRLRISFADGLVRVVDFGPFLQASMHPAIREFLDPKKFQDFTLEHGFLHWDDFGLVFPMADLRVGRIS